MNASGGGYKVKKCRVGLGTLELSGLWPGQCGKEDNRDAVRGRKERPNGCFSVVRCYTVCVCVCEAYHLLHRYLPTQGRDSARTDYGTRSPEASRCCKLGSRVGSNDG